MKKSLLSNYMESKAADERFKLASKVAKSIINRESDIIWNGNYITVTIDNKKFTPIEKPKKKSSLKDRLLGLKKIY